MNLSDPSGLYLVGVSALGLLVGVIINLLAQRLPIMLQRKWREEACDVLGLPPMDNQPIDPKHHGCPRQRSGTIRRVVVALACACLSLATAWRLGFGLETAMALLLVWCLLALSLIDAEHQLLPDVMVLPVLWLGLLVNTWAMFAPLADAVLGAVCGYLSLWSVYWLFNLITGKEGMGYGDFKLMALIGAWGGWQVLPMTLVLASSLGALAGICLMALRKGSMGSTMPFGPFLAAAGWGACTWGAELSAYRLQLLGG